MSNETDPSLMVTRRGVVHRPDCRSLRYGNGAGRWLHRFPDDRPCLHCLPDFPEDVTR